MLANYHTHTSRCLHASGTDEEYIKKAIAEGLKILGFSDHAPYLYPNGYSSYYKMTPEEAPEYISELCALRDKYNDKIQIHIGYEAEYYPDLWDKTLEFWKKTAPPEYLLLGQHFVNEEYNEESRVHSAGGTDNYGMLVRYVDGIIGAINTGKFTYVAHPDVLRYFGNHDEYCIEMHRLMRAVKEADIPLEINLLGICEKRHYPSEIFWNIASGYSPSVILGCDSHSPERVAVAEELYEAQKFAEKHKLNVIDEIKLIDPFE